MHNIGFINFNNKNSYDDLGMKILDKIIVPFPKKKKDIIPVPGSNGDLYVDTDVYEDIVIPMSFEVVNNIHVKTKYREIKRWLDIIEDNHLLFFDDMEFFYKVKDVKVPNDFETILSLYGVVNVIFTCEPFTYLVSGEEAIDIPTTLYNDTGYSSKPTYIIKGEGLITLIVNGNSVTINVGQEVIVNTELQLVFRNGNIENIRKNGKWEHLDLLDGENIISYVGSRVDSISIIPNWRLI